MDTVMESSDMDFQVDAQSTARNRTPLFLEASDDEDDQTPQWPMQIIAPESDTDVQSISRAFSIHSGRSSPHPPGDSSPLTRSPSPRLRELSPTPGDGPPLKKRKVSSKPQSYYLGSMLVGNAWSTVKGKGYIKNGEKVLIERDRAESASSSAKGKGKSKQLTLTAMMKSNKTSNLRKPKVDTVVRLANTRGFEFGRLPQDIADWVSKLMDQGMVDLEGTMIDCPTSLHSGAEMIMSLEISLRSSAFASPKKKSSQSNKKTFAFGQDQESVDEWVLRGRKSALLKLFDVLSLRPRQGIDEAGFKRTQAAKAEQKEPVEEEEGEELSENQLDMIYKKAQKNDQTLDTMDPPDTFVMTLRSYQKQALHWMHSNETGENSSREHSLHPLWSEYTFPAAAKDGVIDLTDDEIPFYFNPYSGELSLEFPKAEKVFRGGILADVGMGKTIMLSALIHKNCAPEALDNSASTTKHRQVKLNFASGSTQKNRGKSRAFATLIVAPTSLLSQWSEELKRSSKPGTLKTLVWHGQNRADLETVTEEEGVIQVVITSYGVIASEHGKAEKIKSPLFEIEWLRIILDEAHHCKLRSSKTAHAVYELKARKRWAVTGTPIVNRLEDLYSLLKFLKFTPWDDFAFFRSFITVPFMARDPKAIEVVQVILESVLLRREKTMRDADGNPIVDLPAKETTIETLEFSLAERKIYDSIYNHAKRDFENLQAKGLVGKNYTHILAMLMRLRRAVLHTSLILTSKSDTESKSSTSAERVGINDMIKRYLSGDDETDPSASGNGSTLYAEDVAAGLADGEPQECPICLDVMDGPMIIPGCLHQCCKECITTYLASCEEKAEPSRCPTCSFGPIKENELLEVVRGEPASASEPAQEVILRKNSFRSSTKIDALLENLRRLRDQDPCFRAVVFSQFTSFLTVIETALTRDSFEYHRFDGSMDVKKRGAAIEAFREQSRSPKVLIVSLKAGGVGLNLTMANHVFLMDCWWNAATENQAIDRVHRIGQQRTVYVKQFIMANTIEERILQIQKRKTAIVKEAFRGKSSGGDESESLENLRIMFEDV